MPCDSSYLEPNRIERERQRAAKLCVYIYRARGCEPPQWAVRTAADIYGKHPAGHDPVVELCALVSAMSDTERDSIVYNARDRSARDLADWWEEHQEADRQRIAKEREDARRAALRKAGLSKLSDDEADALGLGGSR